MRAVACGIISMAVFIDLKEDIEDAAKRAEYDQVEYSAGFVLFTASWICGLFAFALSPLVPRPIRSTNSSAALV
jgi:hypothetical protein